MTEDTFTIRKAAPADLPRIHEIYAAARQFMRDHGNFSQWDGEDAPERLLPGDIEAGNLYVLEEAGEIHAAFAFIIGADPCYALIEQGEWKSDAPYAAVHRCRERRNPSQCHRADHGILQNPTSPISGSIPTNIIKSCRKPWKNRDLRDAGSFTFRMEHRGSRLSG